jgi:hypothetical protein
MPVTTQNSVEYEALRGTSPSTLYPTEIGQLSFSYFTHDQSGAGDATSSVAVAFLPPGRVRLFLPSSVVWCNWTTASATLDLGWDAYNALSDGVAVTADPDGLIDGLSVDTAGFFRFDTGIAGLRLTGGTKLFESKAGVIIRATSQDTAIANGDDLAGYLVYALTNN